ncbi:MAG TPA: aminotransferase class V-fold PLP-dependent enzyme [Acidimicrobiales bacterium]|jgi:glutamate/tyrosine decarboxylase-like PLP-dependent enzyme
MEGRDLLRLTADRIAGYRAAAATARVGPQFDVAAVRAAFGGPLPDAGEPPAEVIDRLVRAAEPALVTSVGPRYFGFVIGGALEAATSADLLATGWDQNGFNATTSPANAIAEEVAGEWLKELLAIPPPASFGLVTGGQGANTVGLAAGRHRVLEQAGWDVEERGLAGGPALRVIASVERHATIDASLRLLGLGRAALVEVGVDDQGAIDVAALREALAAEPDRPTIVCAQAGNVNTGACDDLAAVCDLSRRLGAWVHVDGAFGLWAAASPTTRHLVDGIERADSWATDGHKWLNVPYDSGYAFCADPDAHAVSMSYRAAYLTGHGTGPIRTPGDFVPESSRRARGFATWAALRELGRAGVADLVERCCAHARAFAGQLADLPGVTIANRVVLNQVLVDFGSADRTDHVIDTVQRDGTCWMGGTEWRNRRLMRISVSNAATTADDVEASVAAIRRAL